MENSVTAKRYAASIEERNLQATAQLLHPDVEVHYPQSGEFFKGKDNYLAMLSNYPSGLPEGSFPVVSGEKASVHVTSPLPFGMQIVTVAGSGNLFVIEGTANYDDGNSYNIAVILNMDDGLVARETWYWGSPFPAPRWREPFAE
jgi:hypothetical protein